MIRTAAPHALAICLGVVLGGCGGGTAVIAGSGGGSSGGGRDSAVTRLDVERLEPPSADIRFELTRPKAVKRLTLDVSVPGGSPGEPPELLTIDELDAEALEAIAVDDGDDVQEFVYVWEYARDLGTDAFQEDLVVRARVGDGPPFSTVTDIGNDPPEVLAVGVPAPGDEAQGIVPISFTVADDSETVDVSVEVTLDEERGPDASWSPALPAGLEPGSTAPAITVTVVAQPGAGTEVSFFWDVVEQFGALDATVHVRVTAADRDDDGGPLTMSAPLVSSPFRVENNESPTLVLDETAFLVSDDLRLGLAVPYAVGDDEGDDVRLVFQWTEEGVPFVDLPDEPDLLDALLADPAERAAHRIATPYRSPILGRAVVVTERPDAVELPQIASSQAHLLVAAQAPGGALGGTLDGAELELLRASRVPAGVHATWTRATDLDGPTGALPLGDGTTALVLDGAGPARLRELHLATGEVLRTFPDVPGAPDALAASHDGESALVAHRLADRWRLTRVDLGTGRATLLAEVPQRAPRARVRGVASLGSHTTLLTIDDELVRVDHRAPVASTATTVLDGLSSPWGVVVDPRRPGSVYLAERDAPAGGRVVSLDLATRIVRPVVGELPRPTLLALEQDGTRLLVLTDPVGGDGSAELRVHGLDGSATAPVTTVPVPASGLVTGPDGLRVVALSAADDLAVGGGVEHVRSIAGYDPASRRVTLSTPLPGSGAPARPWRLRWRRVHGGLGEGRLRSGRFVWDSRDLPRGAGRARLRATAYDGDTTSVEHAGFKPVQSSLETAPIPVVDPSASQALEAVTTEDLDGDGRVDLVALTSSGALVAFAQTEPAGTFEDTPRVLAAPPGIPPGSSFDVADLDADGRPDLVVGGVDSVVVLIQSAPWVFGRAIAPLDPGPGFDDVVDLTLADVDGDGDVDIVTANSVSDSLGLVEQVDPRRFTVRPVLEPLGPLETAGPSAVAAADVDVDGDVDLAAAYAVGDGAQVWLQDAPWQFAPLRPTLSPSAGPDGPVDLVLTDVDGDGLVDLVTADSVGDTLTAFVQGAPGDFLPPSSVGDGILTDTPVAVDAADLDGDGRVDLASVNANSDSLTVFLQTAPGSLDRDPFVLSDAASTDFPRGLRATDLDADGDGDLVVASAASGPSLAVFLQSGPFAFESEPAKALDDPTIEDAPVDVVVADLDGDGDVDIASANLDSDRVLVFTQSGAGLFEPIPEGLDAGTAQGLRAIAAADLDGDGLVELVTANRDSDDVAVHHQGPPGIFAAPPLLVGGIATTNGAVDVQVADVDDDGRLDLVVASQTSGMVHVFRQAGPRTYRLLASLDPAGPNDLPQGVAVGDLDGDGRPDLASANRNADSVTWFRQRTDGSFAPAIPLGGPSTTLGPVAVIAADLDLDGLTDLASANSVGGDVTVFRQETAGVFGSTPERLGDPLLTGGVRALAAADLDGDGDDDLVSANFGVDTLTVFLQRAAGGFSPPRVLGGTTTTEAARAVVAADLDGDGDVDLVSANGAGESITVFPNGHTP